jgi:hypothetical protein
MIPPDRSSNPAAAEFFITLLHAATSGHVLHLQTRSYAQHKTLDEFYGELPGLADSIIEAYQGKYGLILDYPSGYATPISEPVQFVSDLGDFVTANRSSVGDDSELQNLINEVMQLIDSTIYKLRFLA